MKKFEIFNRKTRISRFSEQLVTEQHIIRKELTVYYNPNEKYVKTQQANTWSVLGRRMYTSRFRVISYKSIPHQ